MAWQTPKTNWVSSDYFTYTDYNRWVGNVEAIHTLAESLFTQFPIVSLPAKTVNDYPYADEINNLEGNIKTILNKTYQFILFSPKAYYPNQPTLDYNEANRIESAMLSIYNGLNNQMSAIKRLSFTLGGGLFE